RFDFQKAISEMPFQLGRAPIQGQAPGRGRGLAPPNASLSILVSLDVTRQPLRKTLESIKLPNERLNFASPEVKFANVDPEMPVSIQVDGLPLMNVLTMLLTPLGLTYKVEGNTILIEPKSPQPAKADGGAAAQVPPTAESVALAVRADGNQAG